MAFRIGQGVVSRIGRLAGRLLPRGARAGVWCAAAAAAAALCLPAPAALAQRVFDELPAKAQGLELTNNTGQRIPLDLPFTDSTGARVTMRDFFPGPEGKPAVVVMMYYRCPILCPKILQELTKSLNEIPFMAGTDYNVVVVSYDPRDKPADAALEKEAALLAYDRPTSDSVRNGWRFLVSRPEPARELADALGYAYRYLPDSGEYSHGTVIFVLTPDGTIARYLTGIQFPANDLRMALVEAGQGKVGSIVDLFTLWCYHFDAKEGSYVLQAFRVMQIGGLLTVLLLGSLLGALFYGEKRRRRRAGVALGPVAPDGWGGGAAAGGAGGRGAKAAMGQAR